MSIPTFRPHVHAQLRSFFAARQRLRGCRAVGRPVASYIQQLSRFEVTILLHLYHGASFSRRFRPFSPCHSIHPHCDLRSCLFLHRAWEAKAFRDASESSSSSALGHARILTSAFPWKTFAELGKDLGKRMSILRIETDYRVDYARKGASSPFQYLDNLSSCSTRPRPLAILWQSMVQDTLVALGQCFLAICGFSRSFAS